jgi:ABC-type antimicrobial peptide transport system permease subunit
MMIWLSVAFGGAALLLASLGLYGLISYIVHMRYTEIGIRIALGATRSGILALVVSDALSIAIVGILIGVPAVWVTARALASKYIDLRHNTFQRKAVRVSLLAVGGCLGGLFASLKCVSHRSSQGLAGE